MDELLEALQSHDEKRIKWWSTSLFITKGGKPNLPQINEFERYAPCRIIALQKAQSGDWIEGGIIYNGRIYRFGDPNERN